MQVSVGQRDINTLVFLQAEQKKVADTTLEAATGEMADPPKVKLSTKKLLKGHIGKVNSVHYSGDSRYKFTLDEGTQLRFKIVL